MYLKTFEKKLLESGFKFHYATCKNFGWSGDKISWVLDDLKYLKRSNISGIVNITYAEKKDFDRAKKNRLININKQKEQKRLQGLFQFSFGYSETLNNSLTSNKYTFRIDTDNLILQTSWRSATTYYKINTKELEKYLKEYNEIKQL